MIKAKPTSYIFPPRTEQAVPRSGTSIYAGLGWIAQLKYNDQRNLIKHLPAPNASGRKIELWNRHGERHRNYVCPDWLYEQLEHVLYDVFKLSQTEYHLLDGGLMHTKHAALSDTLVVWDILVRDGIYQLNEKYGDRYATLANCLDESERWYFSPKTDVSYDFGIKATENVFMPICYKADKWDDLWDLIAAVNAPWTIGKPGEPNYEVKPLLEGCVYKDMQAPLEFSFGESNNTSWSAKSRILTGRHIY